ncbi:MAG: hypothetical protein M5U29_18700 [Anaerolineae bacterium]|nr:hypothetical protein [Anaerolineae bacterium]
MARLAICLVIGLGLAGCTLWGDADVTAGQVRADLAAHLGEVRAAQAAALALWDRVIFGETVSCQEAIPVPALLVLSPRQREAHPSAEAISAALSEATRAIGDSADLWAIECADPRLGLPSPPSPLPVPQLKTPPNIWRYCVPLRWESGQRSRHLTSAARLRI